MIYLLSFFIFLVITYYTCRFLWELPQISNIEKRVLFITGCDTGFGHLLALKCARQGMTVFAGCLTSKGEKKLFEESNEFKGRLITVPIDVSNEESIKKAAEFVGSRLGPEQELWALVNNAGVFGCYGPDEWCTIEHYRKTVDINTFGPIRCVHAFLPLLKKSIGRIIATASVAGRVTVPWGAPYAVSKYGVEAYMDAIRQELRPFGITCSILEPGAFKTPFLDQDAMKDRVDQTYAELSEEVRKDYVITTWNKRIHLAASNRFDLVVESYYHAITAKFPRCRYRCGWDAHLVYMPLAYMPTEMQDFILSRTIGIIPIPEFLEKIVELVLNTWNNLC